MQINHLPTIGTCMSHAKIGLTDAIFAFFATLADPVGEWLIMVLVLVIGVLAIAIIMLVFMMKPPR